MPNEVFHIQGLGGERKLKGSVTIGGAKNAALPALAAGILFADTVSYENVPDIADVRTMKELLLSLGAMVTDNGVHECSVRMGDDVSDVLDRQRSLSMRASIILTGPLLGRCGSVHFPRPGGCVIGKRPIEMFLEAYEAMGAEVEEKDDEYYIHAPGGLKGAEYFFMQQSHTATETIMMAAVLAEGTTILRNASIEPEITDVAEFLVSCGADIQGIGTHTLTITGTGGMPLEARGAVHSVMPDRLETGSYMILGALCAEELEITSCRSENVEILSKLLRSSGVEVESAPSRITVRGHKKGYNTHSIKTHEYPGFPTDLQAPYVVFLTQASGTASVFEAIFEGRLGHAHTLAAMGADVRVLDSHTLEVRGPSKLAGTRLEAPDIRAGMAFLIAALTAHGESTLTNIHLIDRGYEYIERPLEALGAHIVRKEV